MKPIGDPVPFATHNFIVGHAAFGPGYTGVRLPPKRRVKLDRNKRRKRRRRHTTARE